MKLGYVRRRNGERIILTPAGIEPARACSTLRRMPLNRMLAMNGVKGNRQGFQMTRNPCRSHIAFGPAWLDIWAVDPKTHETRPISEVACDHAVDRAAMTMRDQANGERSKEWWA